MASGSRWCPRCGAEYLAHIETCADCGVPLRDAPPPPPDHDTLTYDLGDWDAGQRRALELLLGGADIAYGWDQGTDLVVPRTAEATVDRLIEEVENPPPAPSPTEPSKDPAAVAGADSDTRLATIGERALARMIDAFITLIPALGLFTATAVRLSPDDQPGFTLLLGIAPVALALAYEVTLTARWGQTLGKWLLGIRVAAPDGNVPGWGRSVRRWLVPFVVSTVPYIGLILAITVFLRAAFVPDRRGFHDLVAGTTVLRTEHPPVDPRTR